MYPRAPTADKDPPHRRRHRGLHERTLLARPAAYASEAMMTPLDDCPRRHHGQHPQAGRVMRMALRGMDSRTRFCWFWRTTTMSLMVPGKW